MHRQLGQLSLIMKYLDYEFWLYLQKHNSAELFFCFRWMLILFKREFPLPDVLRIWEVHALSEFWRRVFSRRVPLVHVRRISLTLKQTIWSDFLCSYHHLFVTAAMILRHREHIVGEEMEFDDILKVRGESVIFAAHS